MSLRARCTKSCTCIEVPGADRCAQLDVGAVSGMWVRGGPPPPQTGAGQDTNDGCTPMCHLTIEGAALASGAGAAGREFRTPTVSQSRPC